MMEKHGEKGLFIEAEGSAEGGCNVLQSIPLKEVDFIPISVVNYVRKTQKDLILQNAKYDDRLMNDIYIMKNDVKSVLCAPIVYAGKIAGIIYLENNLSSNAFTHERLEVLQILNAQAAISIENQRLLKERETAANIQRSLVPIHPAIKDYEVTGFMLPTEEVGGDYYDLLSGDGVDWVVIGDVSGHGVPAGLVMIMVQTCTQLVLRDNPQISPAQLLAKINTVVCHNIKILNEKKYMTLNALAIHQDGKVVHAGLHQDILIYSKREDEVREVETYGIWIGLDEKTGILNEDRQFSVEVGNVILLYTDGITEATDSQGLMFGSDNLKSILKENGTRPTSEIKEQILKGLSKYHKSDDVSLLVMRRTI